MILTADQKDAVTELVNIAFSRTAAALSELTGNRVELTVPAVSSHPIADLLPALGQFVRGGRLSSGRRVLGGRSGRQRDGQQRYGGKGAQVAVQPLKRSASPLR